MESSTFTQLTTTALTGFIYLGVFLFTWRLWYRWSKQSLRPPYPPGPPSKLIIGNLADMPSSHGWEVFEEWGNTYGDVVYANVFGQDIVILNSFAAAWDLLERRSSIYSDRTPFPMLIDLIGWDWNLAFMRYGDRWRLHRKILHQSFNSTTSSTFHEVERKHARALLLKLRDQPEAFFDHIMHMSGSIIVEIIYGLDVLPHDDPYVKKAGEAIEGAIKAAAPGAFLVDTFPILKLIPEWFPGARFKQQAGRWKTLGEEMVDFPTKEVKKQYEASQHRDSFITQWFEKLSRETNQENKGHLEKVVANVSATAYVAGFETSVSSVHDFFLAMLLHPEVQQKAQEELDSVVGSDRLPDFSDQPNLPYVNAICKEILRWRPVLPLGVPHRVIQDDVYNGMFIPKGSQIIVNQWAILHSKTEYGPDAESFNPDRFLKPGVKDPVAAFGFGRRICPGRYMAENSLFIAVSSILHTFKISMAKDKMGNDIPVAGTFTSALTVHPEPFKCAIKVRSQAALELLNSVGIDD